MNSQSETSRAVLIGVLLTICFVLITPLLPFMALPARIFAPLPVLFFRSKLGRQQGLMVLLITAFVIAVLSGGIGPVLLVSVSLMFIGFVLGETFEKRITIERTVLISSVIVLASAIFCLMWYSIQTHIGILSLLHQYVDENISTFLYICKEAGVSNEVTTVLKQQRDHITDFAVLTLPSSTIIAVTLIIWVNIIAAKPLMIRNGVNYPDFGALNQWSTPENLIWGLIGFGSIVMIGDGGLQFVGINGLLVVILAYFFQGIAVTSFYLVKKKISTLAKIAIYSIIAINQILLIVIIGIGIFDVWFNFRKIEAKKE